MTSLTRVLIRAACLLACACCCLPARAGGWADDLAPLSPADWNAARAAHLLERAGFGGTPAEVERLARMTPAEAVDHLVEYERIDDAALPPFDPSNIYPHGHKFRPLEEVVLWGLVSGRVYGVKATQPGKLKYQPAFDEFFTLLLSEHGETRRAGQWWAQRMLLTPRPLEEKLALFWHDHFATSQEKVSDHELMLAHVATLRRHAGGNFRTLLTAVAQDPAMLVWLDNRQNVRRKPNENFAREVLELFTMGEGQGYTEADIRELARAFTGWTTALPKSPRDLRTFVDDKSLHDDGEKTFLGGTGRFDGHGAIDVILRQPAVPKFIAAKVYRYFVREELSPELNERLARVLLDNRYELKPLLKTIFLSRDFYSERSVGTQLKAPVPFLVSTYRKMGLREVPGIPDFTDTAGGLGQVLFYPPNVAGWPGGRSWVNPSTLLARGNAVHAMLFPDPKTFGVPDKLLPEGPRRIPVMNPEYKIIPHVWDPAAGRMKPVSMAEYDRILAGIDATTGGAGKGAMAGENVADGDMMMKPDTAKADGEPAMGMMKGPGRGGGPKSRMSEVLVAEDYNLAAAVYVGFVEAANRLKLIPRNTADVDVVGWVRDAGVKTAADAVDHLGRRFLSVPLQAERREAMVRFLTDAIHSDRIDYDNAALPDALRRTVHLILSAPEYQLG